MAYVNVAEWKTDQVCEWLKGLDNAVLPYVHSFTNHGVSGQQLLSLRPDDLERLGVLKLGHQEIILEAVEHLRNFHYELDRENLQLLALRLSCQARSLCNELSGRVDTRVATQTLADVASVVTAVKPLIRWLDRPPFSGQLEYNERKARLMKLSLEMATCAQRDRFAEKPIEEIRSTCEELAQLADYVVQDIADPMILQPASLDLATLKKRPTGDDLGFYVLPSFHGAHQIAEIKFGSAAHQCGKMEEGDEIVQVNYQTVVGWERKNVLELFRESPTEILLTLKRRPRHTKVYGQIYIKPYRLPSNKKTPYTTRWQHNLPSPRPELLTIPDFTMPLPRHTPATTAVKPSPSPEPMLDAMAACTDDESSGSDSETEPAELLSIPPHATKPTRTTRIRRRATITGASPTTKHGFDIERFWREFKQERNTSFQLRDKAASCAHGLDGVSGNGATGAGTGGGAAIRPQTCLGIEQRQTGKRRRRPEEEEEEATEPEEVDATRPTNAEERRAQGNDTSEKPAENSSTTAVERKDEDRTETNSITIAETEACRETKIPEDEKRTATDDAGETEVAEKTLTSNVARKISDIEKHIARNSEVHASARIKRSESSATISKSSTTAESQSDRLSLDSREASDNVDSGIENATSTSSEPSGRAETSPSKSSNRESSEEKSESAGSCAGNSRESVSSGEEPTTTTSTSLRSFGKILRSIDRALTEHEKLLERDARHDEARCVNETRRETTTSVAAGEKPTPPEPPPRRYFAKPSVAPERSVGARRDSRRIETDSAPTYGNAAVHVDEFAADSSHDEASSVASETRPIVPCDGHVHADHPRGTTRHSTTGREERTHEKYEPYVEKYGAKTTSDGYHHYYQYETTTTSSPPPPPPPRPPTSVRSADIPDGASCSRGSPESSRSRGGQTAEREPRGSVVNKAMMVARSIGLHGSSSKPSTGGTSPRNGRKQNALLKKRHVSVKEVGAGELEGWLTYRSRGAGGAWARAWFVLKKSSLYRFRALDSHKADCLIALTGFTVSQAQEVKSRKHAFKVYHTGTVFYFAADTEDCLHTWLDAVGRATLAQRDTAPQSQRHSGLFSETDDDDEDEQQSQHHHHHHHHHHPHQQYHHHQDPEPEHPAKSRLSCTALPSDCKTPDKSAGFGSLRKCAAPKEATPKDHRDVSGASLDRKYLRFLGAASRNQNVPVPTAQFRSYRRVLPTSTPIAKGKDSVGHPTDPQITIAGSTFYGSAVSQGTEMSSGSSSHDMADYRRAADNRYFGQSRRPPSGDLQEFVTLEEFMLSQQQRHQHRQQRLDEEEQQHQRASMANSHRSDSPASVASTPSISVVDHGQYRPYEDGGASHYDAYARESSSSSSSSQQRANCRRSTTSQSNGCCTAYYATQQQQQQVTSCCQPDWRRRDCARDVVDATQQRRLFRNGTAGSSDDLTAYLQPRGTDTLQRLKKESAITRKGSFNLRRRENLAVDEHQQRCWLDSLKRSGSSCDKQRSGEKARLKNAAQYQPPPMPAGQHDKPDKMRAAFEMHLDKVANEQRAPQKPNRLKSLFGSKCHQKPCTLDLPKEAPMQKTLLGSPKLHRALCRNKSSPQQPQRSAQQHPDDSPAGDSGISGGSPSISSFVSGNGCARALSQSFSSVSSSSAVSPDWSPDSQAPCLLNATKLNSNHHSTSSTIPGMRNCLAPPTLPYIPPPSSPPPPVADDYPGLEYPPVFEPGTYSLSDASLLRNRNKNSHHQHHHHHHRHNHPGGDGNREDNRD